MVEETSWAIFSKRSAQVKCFFPIFSNFRAFFFYLSILFFILMSYMFHLNETVNPMSVPSLLP